MATTFQNVPTAFPEVTDRSPTETIFRESCPTLLRPFLCNFLRLVFIVPAILALLYTLLVSQGSSWSDILGTSLAFSALFGW